MGILKHHGDKHDESTPKSSTVTTQTKDISKEEKLRKVRTLVGYNSHIESIAQEVLEFAKKKTAENVRSVEKQPEHEKTLHKKSQPEEKLQENIKSEEKSQNNLPVNNSNDSKPRRRRKATFITENNKVYYYINNFDHFIFPPGYFDEDGNIARIETTNTEVIKSENSIATKNNSTTNTVPENIQSVVKGQTENIQVESKVVEKEICDEKIKSAESKVVLSETQNTKVDALIEVEKINDPEILQEKVKDKIVNKDKKINEEKLLTVVFDSEEEIDVGYAESRSSETSLDRALNGALEYNEEQKNCCGSSSSSSRRRRRARIEFDEEDSSFVEESLHRYILADEITPPVNEPRPSSYTTRVVESPPATGFFGKLCMFFCCGTRVIVTEERNTRITVDLEMQFIEV